MHERTAARWALALGLVRPRLLTTAHGWSAHEPAPPRSCVCARAGPAAQHHRPQPPREKPASQAPANHCQLYASGCPLTRRAMLRLPSGSLRGSWRAAAGADGQCGHRIGRATSAGPHCGVAGLSPCGRLRVMRNPGEGGAAADGYASSGLPAAWGVPDPLTPAALVTAESPPGRMDVCRLAKKCHQLRLRALAARQGAPPPRPWTSPCLPRMKRVGRLVTPCSALADWCSHAMIENFNPSNV